MDRFRVAVVGFDSYSSIPQKAGRYSDEVGREVGLEDFVIYALNPHFIKCSLNVEEDSNYAAPHLKGKVHSFDQSQEVLLAATVFLESRLDLVWELASCEGFVKSCQDHFLQ